MYMSTTADGYLTDAFAVGVVVYSLAFRDYPWRSTRRSECKCFDYVSGHGLRAFLGRRRLRQTGTPMADAISDG